MPIVRKNLLAVSRLRNTRGAPRAAASTLRPARHDSAVALVVSKGREPIQVPGVVGSGLDDARAAITGRGLLVGEPTTATSETVAEGDVISQAPDGGDTLLTGLSGVVIVVVVILAIWYFARRRG